MTVLLILILALVLLFIWMMYMPGESYRGPLPVLDEAGQATAKKLQTHVERLCRNPAGRDSFQQEGLNAARQYIADRFEASGYEVRFLEYPVGDTKVANIEVSLAGTTRPDEIIVVGAHYDAVQGAPGANDNGSGVAAVLELADRFRNGKFDRSLRLVAFVNEEPPHFMTGTMGSLVYAKQAVRNGDNIVAMFSLETIGYFSDVPGSQKYPPFISHFYPAQGDFIAIVGNLKSRGLVTRSLHAFRSHAVFPSEGIAAPAFIPGISWSDHWSFWQQGFPAVMITDTALFRYPYYHTAQDTPDKVDYRKMVYVVDGIGKMLGELLNEK